MSVQVAWRESEQAQEQEQSEMCGRQLKHREDSVSIDSLAEHLEDRARERLTLADPDVLTEHTHAPRSTLLETPLLAVAKHHVPFESPNFGLAVLRYRGR